MIGGGGKNQNCAWSVNQVIDFICNKIIVIVFAIHFMMSFC